MTRYAHLCDRCGNSPTRLYPCGHRCADHTPAALAGLPEPGRTATAYRPQVGYTQPTSTVLDDRAIASGKRRSNPKARREAVAREEARRAV